MIKIIIKTIFFLSLLLIPNGITNTMTAQGVDYKSYAPPPQKLSGIPAECTNIGSWQGPYQKNMTRTVSLCNGDCNISIVYYERTVTGCQSLASGAVLYEVYVAGIFYNDVACANCDKKEITMAFLAELYDEVGSEHPTWYPFARIDSNDETGGMTQFDIYLGGACYQTEYPEYTEISRDAWGNPLPCEDIVVCRNALNWNWRPSTHESEVNDNYPIPPWDITVFTQSNEATTYGDCQPPCYEDCWEDLMFKYVPELQCDFPCNTGEWILKSSPPIQIDLPGCETCSIILEYKTRETEPCGIISGDVYQDIQLDKITFSSNCSHACLENVPEQYFHELATDWLLKNELPDPPLPGGCKTNVRFITNSCWGDFYYGLPPHRLLEPCGYDDCCISIYLVCNIGTQITSTLIETINDPPMCHVWPYGCYSVCSELQQKIATQNFENSEIITVHPNPASNKVHITIKNQNEGSLMLIITDALGNLLFNDRCFSKEGSLNIDINTESYSSGNYYIKVILPDGKFETSSFIIQK